MRPFARLASVLLLPLAVVACPSPTATRPGPSLLLITVDTVRADRLASYGRAGARTPASDRLAREGTRFEAAVTPLPRTTPAVASILTGLAPTGTKVRGLWSSLPSDIPTLAGWLRESGWQTGAFTSNIFLRPASGVGKDFEAYSNPQSRWAGNSAPEITREALEWLAGVPKEKRFFLWVHYLDPHWTYDPPPPYDTLYDPGFKGPWPYNSIAAGDSKQGDIIFRNTMSPEQVRHAIALYEGEIAATEAEVARLLDAMTADGRLNSTLVIYTSDHGESLGEHNYFFDHGEFLYDGTLLVPLIMRLPGRVPQGLVVKRMATLMDIAPTALALLGEPLPSGLDGRSLAGDLAGEPGGAERRIWIESDHTFVRPENPRQYLKGFEGKWRGSRGEREKLIFIPRDPQGATGDIELYDIAADPGETHNLSREEPDATRVLMAKLRSWWTATSSADAGAPGEPLPDREILRSLGYAGGP